MNLCDTLAEWHQVLRVYLGAGNHFPLVLQIEKEAEFYVGDYNEGIKAATVPFHNIHDRIVPNNAVTVKRDRVQKRNASWQGPSDYLNFNPA